MKNIFIMGVAKSGKSTFAKKLQSEGKYNHIPLDYFTSSLKRNFPELNITSDVKINKESSKKLSLLLSRVIEIIDNGSENFIIDSAHILPEDILPYLNLDKWDVYFFGYPSINASEKLKEIRKYETEYDWTYKKSDQELLDIFLYLIDLSKKVKNNIEGVKFIDTSKGIKNLEII